jgi:hypothetical protein
MHPFLILNTTIAIFILFVGSLPAPAGDVLPIRIGATVSMGGPDKERSLMIQKSFQLWEHQVNQKRDDAD